MFGLSVRQSVCPLSVKTYFAWRDVFLVSKGVSMEHGIVSGHCWKGFQGQRSKVKVIARSNALLWRKLTFRRCGIEDHLFDIKMASTFQRNTRVAHRSSSIWLQIVKIRRIMNIVYYYNNYCFYCVVILYVMLASSETREKGARIGDGFWSYDDACRSNNSWTDTSTGSVPQVSNYIVRLHESCISIDRYV